MKDRAPAPESNDDSTHQGEPEEDRSDSGAPPHDDKVDEASKESFPTSDPPAW